KDDIHARAYVQFKTPDALVAFHSAFDGNLSRAVVEFAPYQKCPPPPDQVKKDARQGTIESGQL
ncbi:hypothetical protein T439DRAFT_285488, partial [Meredithblackwellia eburnea MCA 4105]